MYGVRKGLSIGMMILAAFTTSAAEATTVNLTSGTTGTDSQQSFYNLTRGADVTVLGATSRALSSMTLAGINFGSVGPGAAVTARVYPSGGGASIASGTVSVSAGFNQTVVVPISATLVAGNTYRLCFYATSGSGGSITGAHLFDPTPSGAGGFPFTESSGTLRVVQAYGADGGDVFPTTQSDVMPYISAEINAVITPVPGQTYYNQDLLNVGANSAADVAVLLSGSQAINWHWSGYSHRWFQSFAFGPSGPNTLLRWQTLNEVCPNPPWEPVSPCIDNDLVDTGEIFHGGWGSSTPHQIIDMWWTDATGARKPGSVVYDMTSGWTYQMLAQERAAPATYAPVGPKDLAAAGDAVVVRYRVTGPGSAAGVISFAETVPLAGQTVTGVTWNNAFNPAVGGTQTLTVQDVHYAVLSSPIPPDFLNAGNATLAAALQPLPGGTSLSVPPGQTAQLPIPAGPAVPGVDRNGMLIMSLLLLLGGSYGLLRKRGRGSLTA